VTRPWPPVPRMKNTVKLEAEFVDTVIEMAQALGWLVAHFRPGRTAKGWVTPMQGNPGFPDLVLVHPKQHRVLMAECKSHNGRLTEAQTAWLTALRAAGIEAFVWRPDHMDQVRELLSGGDYRRERGG
jgi:hypothetical protein